jgi:hypothetical protein
MHEPCPTSGPAQEPPRVPPPRLVLDAVRLMYAGAVVEVVAVVVALVSQGTINSAILARHPAYTAAQLHTAEGALTVPLIAGGSIAAGLWIWMAWANRQGRGWARVVSAVFFGINTLDLIAAAFVARSAVASLVVSAVIWLVGLAVIVLIFSRQSSPFYSRPAA